MNNKICDCLSDSIPTWPFPKSYCLHGNIINKNTDIDLTYINKQNQIPDSILSIIKGIKQGE